MTLSPAAPAPSRRRALVGLVLFLGLFVVYLANGTVLDEGDAVPSINLPVALLSTGRLSFDPEGFPELFKWKSHPPFTEKTDFFFTNWDDIFGTHKAREWVKTGELELNGPRYYIVPTRLPNTYVSTFGPIPGLLLLPVIAPFYAFDHALAGKLALRDSVAKLGSAAMVALVALLIFLILDRRTSRWAALLVALTYALGTCAWAISSQNIWQQTVDQLLLMLGAYFALSGLERRSMAALAGLSLGAAAACRPTSAVAPLFLLVYLYVYHRKSVLPFLLGVVPVPLAVLAYNQHYFGSPFLFAQALIGHSIALEKTGSPDVWQTPFWMGAFGLLFCPSRGVMIFSPILGASFFGLWRARRPKYREFWPFFLTALVLMAVQCKWFDWWGGHAYGYRPWLDSVPYLTLALLPVVGPLTETPLRRGLAGLLLGWSIFVQALGAMSYDRYWNLLRVFVSRVPTSVDALDFPTEAEARRVADAQGGYYVGPSFCDIDLVFCRHRLWSFTDNLILYQLQNYSLSRSGRLPFEFSELGQK